MSYEPRATSQEPKTTNQLPSFLHRFFWEYDPEVLDLHKHADVIMARIMERGTWQAMLWLRTVYPPEVMARFLSVKGWKVLPPREVNYWALLSGLPEDIKKQLVRKAAQRDGIWGERSAC